ELVGILDEKRLVLYLDHAGDNSPVKDAKLQLEFGGAAVEAKPAGEGLFEVALAQAPKPGVIPVTATVVAGAGTDLLAGELDLHEASAKEAPHVHDWRPHAIVGGILLLAAIAFLALRRVRRQR